MNHWVFEFDVIAGEQREMLLALLADAGFDGFEEADKSLKAFIRETDLNETGLAEIFQLIPVNYRKRIIEEQNWNAQWETGFEPVVVNDFVAVRASFHQPIKGVTHEIIITPKMSFGTGHHATTYLVMEQMEQLDLHNKKVLDFGTGTGILAILAEKMGAAEVEAIDNDEWAINNCRENIAANGCTNISLQKGETIPPDTSYDLILANINLNVILNNLPGIARVSREDSMLLLSGFFATDEAVLLTALAENGFRDVVTSKKGEWASIFAIKA